MIKVKAVIFDLDDTLIKSKINYERMKNLIIDFLASVGVASGLLNKNMPNFEIVNAAKMDLSGKVSRCEIEKILNKVNDIMDEVELKSLGDAELMDNALSTLKELKKMGLKAGIVTNGCRKYAEEIMSRFCLGKYVDAIVARDDVSNPKPDPEHLLRVLEILNVPVEGAVFVGDHWIDALCAKKAGVPFILLRSRTRIFKEAEEMSYAKINTLRDILLLLQCGKEEIRNNY
ncbi:HAD family hydrolase [Candidatus Bathyarchaeota archaeon]|nr:HAD family hydrolase [Candidatus Bathyarchaeota archaeon]